MNLFDFLYESLAVVNTAGLKELSISSTLQESQRERAYMHSSEEKERNIERKRVDKTKKEKQKQRDRGVELVKFSYKY